MKLISWNVNGIRACVKNGFVSFLVKEKPDLLGLQEIKISDEARLKETFDFQNYEEFWYPAERPGYSGTAILAKNKVVVKNGLSIKELDTEGRVQTVELKDFYLVNVYFPNANHELSRLDFKIKFNQALLKYLKKLETKKPVVVCGDFNVAHREIDLARPKENEGNAGFTVEERAWADELERAGFVDTFRHLHPTKQEYSWWSYRMMARDRDVGWRIDSFWVSQKLVPKIKKAWILGEVFGSDHAPVGLEIDLSS
ncbi:MAG: exodeoxyribonuclease III [Candidatus Paceibacterota bacterium]|jgi:exodeoxyribonuclease-3